MDAITDLFNVIEAYFRAWQNHNVADIQRIFADQAIYKIGPRNRDLVGKEEISAYWRRNKKRQKELSVEWELIGVLHNSVKASFHATFYDTEENNKQSITGIITFFVNDSNKISLLSEHYSKKLITQH